MTIANNRDLRIAYTILALAEEHNKPDLAMSTKKTIRNYLSLPPKHRRIIRSSYDDFVELVELPAFIRTAEEADEYFMDALFIEPTYAAWDCTGKPFTRYYKLFQRHNRWMAYHFVNYDV